jgi:hypothetical protein
MLKGHSRSRELGSGQTVKTTFEATQGRPAAVAGGAGRLGSFKLSELNSHPDQKVVVSDYSSYIGCDPAVKAKDGG